MPARKCREFALYARKGAGPWLHYTGKRFADYGRPMQFRSLAAAKRVARFLLAKNRAQLHGYRITASCDGAPRERLKTNPLPLLFAQLSHANTAKESLETLDNPRPRETRAVHAAAERLKAFSGHPPAEVVMVKERPFKAGLVIGHLNGVPYTTVRDGKTENYLHEFKETARPLLVASSDGRSLRIVGGRFRFTEAGIVDD